MNVLHLCQFRDKKKKNKTRRFISLSLVFENERMLWLTRGLSVLEMKPDNELPISLPVLFKSVKVTCDSTDPEDHLNFI